MRVDAFNEFFFIKSHFDAIELDPEKLSALQKSTLLLSVSTAPQLMTLREFKVTIHKMQNPSGKKTLKVGISPNQSKSFLSFLLDGRLMSAIMGVLLN